MSYVKGVSLIPGGEEYVVINEYEKNPSLQTLVQTARDFGSKVRETQDKQLYENYKKLRQQFRKFCDAISKEWRLTALDAYYDEYCREPADMEYQ